MRFLLCLCFCLFFCSTHGQIDGDPAPGRSPGPPTLRPVPVTTSAHRSQHTPSHSSPSGTARHTRANNSWENETNPVGSSLGPAPDDPRNPISSLKNNETTPDGDAEQTTGQTDLDREDVQQRRHHRSSCAGASLYVSPAEHIYRNYAASSSSVEHPIRLEVTHSLFDTRHGLTNQIIYDVQLTMIPGAISDFYLETVVDDEAPVGQFVDADVSDVATMIMRRNASLSTRVTSAASVVVDNEVPANVDTTALDEADSWRQMVELLYPKHGTRVKAQQPEDNEVRGGAYDTDGDAGTTANGGSNEIVCTFCVCPNVWTETGVQRVRRDIKWFFDRPGLHNKTVKFRLMFRKVTSSAVFETVYMHHLLEDCYLTLLHPSASLDFTHLPLYNNYENCTVFFPPSENPFEHTLLPSSNPTPDAEGDGFFSAAAGATGLLVQITRLNVPCRSGGYIAFDAAAATNASRRLCGKIEDLDTAQRTHHLTVASAAIRLVRHPTFRLDYRLVDFCYNVSFTGRNASYRLQPVSALNCSFSVHLPYGNRIELNVATNEPHEYGGGRSVGEDAEFLDLNMHQADGGNELSRCHEHSLFVQLVDPKSQHTWQHCINSGSQSKRYNVVSAGNTLVIRVWRRIPAGRSATVKSSSATPSLHFDYVALAERKFESKCAFGWIAVQQLCVAAVEQKATWPNAEKECKRRGGNLAVVRSEREQRLIDVMLVNSPGFRDNVAYWIGASDSQTEGEFRWSSGYPFSFANWFPGYAEHNNYNKQPNDDGLSSQDCVEIRHFFQPPVGVSASTVHSAHKANVSRALTFMWNDRDCGAENFFLCERPMSETLNDKFNWTTGCNRTVLLTRDRPRASLWSPNFPFEYPDNTDCFTVIKAPEGFNVVLEFEEFSLEKEPECSYDFLEIIDAAETHSDGTSKLGELYRKYLQQKQPHRSKRSATQLMDSIYKQFLELYRTVRSVVLRIPMSNADTYAFLAAKALPHRVCGDWNSKLKLLRFTSSSAVLGLHFSSDYSHHASGYKAKVSIKNITSECKDDRLIPYNGACYLFASYPEVDWTTAQSVCRGADAELASITAADEQRFIVEHIRNQIDYTSQAVYWTGGQLAFSADFAWSDGRNMSFKGWLPGEEAAAIERHNGMSTCLGLKWKMSPTPMLPSGVYWTAENCRKFGGYVCKSKQTGREGFVENRTINGVEGRLTSPGYPNAYPANVDYWVKLNGPTNTRLIIQFQTLDLEAQDECLYDYISIQDTSSEPKKPSETNKDSVKFGLGNTDYSPQDFHANHWFHNDVPRIKRRKRDLKRVQQRFPDHDIATGTLLPEDPRSRHQRIATNLPSSRSPLPSTATTINEPSFQPYVRWCGSHQSNMTRFDFVASDNAALLHFHSDYSQSLQGFSIIWSAVDVSVCPHHKLSTPDGILASPNYPHFLLNRLDCSFEILTASGKRVWLEFQDFEVMQDSLVEVDLGSGVFVPFRQAKQLNDGIFVSEGRRLVVRLRTGALPRGRGFRATYRTISIIQEELNLSLGSDTSGWLYHLNYPRSLPGLTNYTQHLTAPVGYVIFLEIFGVGFSDQKCSGEGSLEIYDHYAEKNGTVWHLCQLPNSTHAKSASNLVRHFVTNDRDDLKHDGSAIIRPPSNNQPRKQSSASPVHITSFLNTLHIRQYTENKFSALRLNASVRIIADLHYKYKLVDSTDDVESCTPNPCQFGGKCVSTDTENRCQCTGHYTGRFCGLGVCEVDPCVFGKCMLTNSGFKCKCQVGYVGRTCDQKQQPCAANPCEGRGECFNRNGGFFCRCHAWWEGQRCEKRMSKIPYKPLSDRMLQEPFWLGLITVFVVLAFIGLVWCAKRHFPEKIEKLLTEEAERNRPPGMISGNHHHHQSLREQLQFTNTASTHSTVSTPGQHRTIFTRLGIRRPSIISINSSQPPIGTNYSPTARTTSLDDILRSSHRRSPSPRKRNNSTPTKTNAAEKTQILQKLIAPAGSQARENVDLNELISLSAQRPSDISGRHRDIKETTLSENSEVASLTSDARLEKKVSFARLLNKVSAEMSSGSETTNTALDLPDGPVHRRASSMPPSPCDMELRSPHSRSANHSSESMSSSEAMLPNLSAQANRFGTAGRPKVSSADSILTMFKNLANQPSPKTMLISPSSSSHNGDDDSSISSLHTPVSFNSCPPEASTSSSYLRQNAYEVPALDLLKTTNNQNPTSLYLQPPGGGQMDLPSNINQCLSPIRELPTPMPSPALTPIMHRPHVLFSRFYSADDRAAAAAAAAANHSEDDEHINGDSENRAHSRYRSDHHHYLSSYASTDRTGFPNWSTQQKVRSPQSSAPVVVVVPLIQISHDEDQPSTTDPTTHQPSAPHLIATRLQSSAQSPVRPKQLIIPKLVVEQSSPVAERLPVLYLGSPPPQRQSVGETNFYTATPQQRKLLKQMDKPTSLDLLCIPPTITITPNTGDSSDNDLNVMPSDGKLMDNRNQLRVPSAGMCYLSPFSMCSRNDRSEGNLSSSGYSSMASPGPSRCGSNNPLLPGEMEDPGCGSSMHYHPTLRFGGFASRGQTASKTSAASGANGSHNAPMKRARLRSDSETLSDDILLESNDEGIETDHLDDRIDALSPVLAAPPSADAALQLIIQPMQQLQLPTISIQATSDTDTATSTIITTNKAISPVSSRSESPISSDRNTGPKRFSSLFYGSKEMDMPFTDSDGLYDFPSSDAKLDAQHSRKTSLRRRERKLSRGSGHRTPSGTSPTKQTTQLLEASPAASHLTVLRRSPKRRAIARHKADSSSSSSESVALIGAGNEPVKSRAKKKVFTNHLVYDASTSVPDQVNTMFSEDEYHMDIAANTKNGIVQLSRPNRRISRLRAFGNQLRFLRRFEQSLSKRHSPGQSSTANVDVHSSGSYAQYEENTSNDDAEVAFVTSPLLNHNTSTTDNRNRGTGEDVLLGTMAESTALVRRQSPAKTRAYHQKLQQQLQSNTTVAGGTRKPWRTRNRRFVYSGSINSD